MKDLESNVNSLRIKKMCNLSSANQSTITAISSIYCHSYFIRFITVQINGATSVSPQHPSQSY